jgi:hypothetical protein
MTGHPLKNSIREAVRNLVGRSTLTRRPPARVAAELRRNRIPEVKRAVGYAFGWDELIDAET